MIDLNYKEITKIMNTLEEKVEDLNKTDGYSDTDMSPIMQLQNHIEGYSASERFKGDAINPEELSDEAREILQIQRIIDKFESEINKVTFSFSLRGKAINSITNEDSTS